nr:MAG TPA: hypothetical protein [Caudoviricetes sp.]
MLTAALLSKANQQPRTLALKTPLHHGVKRTRTSVTTSKSQVSS